MIQNYNVKDEIQLCREILSENFTLTGSLALLIQGIHLNRSIGDVDVIGKQFNLKKPISWDLILTSKGCNVYRKGNKKIILEIIDCVEDEKKSYPYYNFRLKKWQEIYNLKTKYTGKKHLLDINNIQIQKCPIID